jgi:hypothetical protein
MANMSYCRFENTVDDLSDCQSVLREIGLEGLSKTELDCAKQLISLCIDIAETNSDLLDCSSDEG